MRGGLLLAQCLGAGLLFGQVPVPFLTHEDRFMVFEHGRFEKLEPRPPSFIAALEDQVVYRDHQGQLKCFLPEGRRMHLLDRAGSKPQATRKRIAWLAGDTLKGLREGKAMALAVNVAAFSLSDSLIALHDSAVHELRVLHRGRVHQLARVERMSGRPQWLLGSNTLVFYSHESLQLSWFYRGRLRVLCDSSDYGLAVAGGDVVGYWDGGRRAFMANWKDEPYELSDLRPMSARAGEGLVAFVDAHGRLKCFERGTLHRVTDDAPSAYWVKDSLLLFLDQGRLMLFQNGNSTMVEPYVPERWQVEGGLLAYLDMNRELRGIMGGERFRFGTEANIKHFDLFGERVVYRSPLGTTVVATRRRTYVF